MLTSYITNVLQKHNMPTSLIVIQYQRQHHSSSYNIKANITHRHTISTPTLLIIIQYQRQHHSSSYNIKANITHRHTISTPTSLIIIQYQRQHHSSSYNIKANITHRHTISTPTSLIIIQYQRQHHSSSSKDPLKLSQNSVSRPSSLEQNLRKSASIVSWKISSPVLLERQRRELM
ncbi:hypothetical protein EGW08_002472 [Elysia chlorotica]|uniref:Uncharacterized protein n=1 Tax=Elysia chlorotica TaxID=188477 RepID=A0A433U7F2_ELYCH|nr:hypothetical protein EGW08_002472 [Elysia chlorotica]